MSLIPSRPSGNDRSRLRRHVFLLLILLVAAGLRFAAIGRKSLWLDEVMSVRLAKMDSIGAVVKEVASYDVHPPLYPVLHHFWMKLGEGDGFSRVPSAIFGVGAVFVMYLLGDRLLGRRAGLVAAGLLAVSSFHVSTRRRRAATRSSSCSR